MKRKPKDLLKKISYQHALAVVIIIIIYAIWKAYVLQTPSLTDDNIPDKVRDAVLIMVWDPDGRTIAQGDLI